MIKLFRFTLFILCGFVTLHVAIAAGVSSSATNASGSNVLLIEMTQALCALEPRRQKLRQCREGYNITIKGLQMQQANACHKNLMPNIPPLQRQLVDKVMPDDFLREQSWQRYGRCSPLDSRAYFKSILDHALSIKLPKIFSTSNSYVLNKQKFVNKIVSLNKGMKASSIRLVCQNDSKVNKVRTATSTKNTLPILTELQICYHNNKYSSCSSESNPQAANRRAAIKRIQVSCGENFIVHGDH